MIRKTECVEERLYDHIFLSTIYQIETHYSVWWVETIKVIFKFINTQYFISVFIHELSEIIKNTSCRA